MVGFSWNLVLEKSWLNLRLQIVRVTSDDTVVVVYTLLSAVFEFLLYLPSERSETGRYTVFTFVCLCVCEHSVQTLYSDGSWQASTQSVFQIYSMRAWKVDNISVQTIYCWICVSLAFWCCSQVQDRSGVLGEMYKNVTVISSKCIFRSRAVMTSFSFKASRRTTPQRDHSLVNMHQTVRLLPSEDCIRQCSLGQARSIIIYFSFRINTATVASKMTVAAVN